MARVDKTDSAIGVVRAVINADFSSGDYDNVIGVGLNSSGKVVKGAGQTGIIGVVIPSKKYKAGTIADIFIKADIVEVAGLAAGTKYWIDGTTGALVAGGSFGAQPGSGSGSTGGSAYAGFTVEADRLILEGF